MARIDGTADADTLNGTAGNDRIRGLDGDDVLFGFGGRDRIIGGLGQDFMIGGEGNDTFDGSTGPLGDGSESDQITYNLETGGNGVTIDLIAGFAIDTFGDTDVLIDIEAVRGTLLDDSIRGGNSDNDGYEGYMPFGGNDTIDGGSGFDELRYDRGERFGATNGVTVDFAAGTATDMFGGTDVFSGIEAVRGSVFNDMLYGDSGDNRFRAGTGRDFIDGRDGNDRLDFSRDDGGSGIWINLKKGRAIDTGGDRDRVLNIENVRGTDENDTITGGDDDNNLEGRDGNDTIQGARGNDDVFGGDGNDRVLGGVGDDTVNGGNGADTLKGGSGADIFVISDFNQVDRIVDFKSIDTLAIQSSLVGLPFGEALVDGEDFVLGFQNSAVVNRPTFILTPNGNLLFDADGTGGQAAETIARFVETPQLSADDIFFF